MRLRQLLSIFLVLIVCGVMAAAATSELKNVSVVSQGTSTTVTLVTTGAFGHNEYKANETLLLVDLTGVWAGKLKDVQRNLEAHGVQSYHVVAYKGMGGVDVARLELRIAADSEVKTAETPRELVITVVSKGEASAVAPQGEANPAPSIAATPAKSGVTNEIVKVQNVSVVRGNTGITVEVVGSAPMTAKLLKLTSPDRVVMDIPNSRPAARPPVVTVNGGDVKTVRTARYQQDPPVTRVVVDLLSAHDYELSAAGNKLFLKLLPPGASGTAAASVSQPAPMNTPASNSMSAATSPAPSQPAPSALASLQNESKGGSAPLEAKPVVYVEPKYQTKRQENGDPGTAADRAAQPTQTAALQQPPAPFVQVASGSAAAQPVPAASPSAAPAPKPYTGEPVSVNLKDVDLKDFFRLIHEISGLNVVLDPGVSGSLTLVLDDVPWDQALDIVLKNNGLDKQLEGNVLRIATIDNLRKEAQAKRLQIEAESLAVPKVSITRFLSYAHAKDVMPTVKKLLSTRGEIVADERMNALVVQDIPSVIPDVDRLIAQLDRKTLEVDIEARVVAATRSFNRDIGSLVGLGWGNGATAVGGVPAVGNSTVGGNVPAPQYFIGVDQTKFQSIPLVSNLLPTKPSSGLSFMNATNNYRIDLMLAAAEKRGLLKILSRPHVVTQNNVQALVKQGMRIPITTQQQLGGPPTVQYMDAVLRLQVTPQITADHTIFLNVDIENTQADLSTTVQGNPVFLTQQTTTQVLVTDGGTVLIGGVIQTQNSVNTEQVPFLGNVPVLGNLFKHRVVDNSTQELIFIITPRVVQI